MSDELRNESLDQARFSGDIDALNDLHADSALHGMIEHAASSAQAHSARRHFLSEAVRVDASLLPGLDGAFQDVQARAHLDLPMEAYIYSDASVNGSVLRSCDHLIVALSSGAVETLTPSELDFIIGHELGHVVYGHLDVPVRLILQREQVDAKQAMKLFAWLRKAEISADRAGLVCTGSLAIAASALFKTVSGLHLDGAAIDPDDFANQWQALANEVMRDAARDHWQATHPFPALRMKALIDFWHAFGTDELIPGAPADRRAADCDREIESMLALMDPTAHEKSDLADPILGPFLLWGGLYVLCATGGVADHSLDGLRSLVGRDAVNLAVDSDGITFAQCRQSFVDARAERRAPLSAVELQRLFGSLVGLVPGAASDQRQVAALHDLASICGVSDMFINSVLQQSAA